MGMRGGTSDQIYRVMLMFLRRKFIVDRNYHNYPEIVTWLKNEFSQTTECERFFEFDLGKPALKGDFVKAYALFLYFGKRSKASFRAFILKFCGDRMVEFTKFLNDARISRCIGDGGTV